MRVSKLITFTSIPQQVFITAKYNANTEHIVRMVRQQKTSKSTSLSKPTPIAQKPKPIAQKPTHGNKYHYQQRNKQPNHQPEQEIGRAAKCENQAIAEHKQDLTGIITQELFESFNNIQGPSSENLQVFNKNPEYITRRKKELKKEDDLDRGQITKEVAREKQKEKETRDRAVTETIFVTIENKKAPAMNGHGPRHVKVANGQDKHNDGKPPLRAILGNSASQRQQDTSTVYHSPESSFKRPRHPRVMYPGHQRTTGVSVNHRLKVTPQSDAPTPAVAPITPPASPEDAQTTTAAKATYKEDIHGGQGETGNVVTNPKVKVPLKFDPSLDPVSTLNFYCAANDFEKPAYNIFNKLRNLHCSVQIAGDVYSSYPQEFTDKETAYQRTAQIAIQRIMHAQSHQKLSACTFSDVEFIDGLYKELLKHPHGILGHKLEDWYGSTFRQHLPSHWYDLIVKSNKIRVEHGIDPRIILFANDPGSSEPDRTSITTLPQMVLPWQSSEGGSHDWNMFISFCDSTKLVWARMIDQIANFEELTKHIGRQMESPHFRQKVSKPYAQEVYLVEMPDGWNRVRAISVDEETRSGRYHFIDFGDVAMFHSEDLFQCPPQFLALPAQAVCLSMYALDKFEDHPHALQVLTKELDGQTVVAHVLTTEKQFLELGGSAQGVVENGKRRACLVATLYDTSTAEDIHLNDLVAKRITKCTPAPSLSDEKKIGKTTPILVSHINDDGDLMVLLRNDDLKFVERSIAQTVADLGEQDRVSYSDLLHDRHIFVCDETVDGVKQWFRGRLVTRPLNPDEESFDVYYVDDGRQRKAHISNIYRLEANNRALATFPPQAIPVRLHDVPEIGGHMLHRLRGLIPWRTEALVSVLYERDVLKACRIRNTIFSRSWRLWPWMVVSLW